jgi:hypothetical protein
MKRRILKYAGLMTMLSLGLTAAFVIGGPIAAAQGQGTGNCLEGSTKLDFSAETYTINAGSAITTVAIKAGNDCLLFPPLTSNSCYTVSGLGTTTVTITRIGSGRTCKEISHVEYTTGTSPPPPPPPPPTTSTVTTSTVSTTT